MKRSTIFIASLLLAVSLFSCKKDKETIGNIEIRNIYFNGTDVSILSEEEAEADVNENLKIEATIVSNFSQSQALISIHHAFDAHDHDDHDDHARLSTTEEDLDTLSYGPEIIYLSGNNNTVVVFEGMIDEHTKDGEYHLEIVVLDENANKATKVFPFHIHNDAHTAHEEEEHEEEEQQVVEEAH